MPPVILLLVIFLRSFVEGEAGLFKYQKLIDDNNKPPLYVNEMETINVYTKSWDIVVGIDMRSYSNELKHLQNVVADITQFCSSITRSCRETATELTNTINDINSNWMQVTSMERKSEESISNIYLQKFDEIKKTNQVSNRIIDNGATYIEVSRELILDNEDELEKQKQYIGSRLENCKKISQEITKGDKIKQANLNDIIEEIMSYATIIIFNFQSEQETFIEMLRSEILLSEETLLNEFKELLNIIKGKKLKIPFDMDVDPITKFYDITTRKSTIMNNIFIVTYKLPLVDSLAFQLYHLNTCPQKIKQDIFGLILPDYEYIAISKDKRKYITFDEDEVKECYHGNVLLCELTSAIMYTENSESCSVNFLTKSEISSCKYVMAKISSELWMRLQVNSWLFVFTKPTQVTIECNNEVDTRYMNGEGILTIDASCSVKTPFVEIMGSTDRINKIYEEMTLSSEKNIDWKTIIDKIRVTNNVVNHFIAKVIDQKDLDIFEKINIAVNHIKPLMNQTFKERTWHQLNEIEMTNCIISVLVIFVMIFKTVNYIRRCFIPSTNNEHIDFV